MTEGDLPVIGDYVELLPGCWVERMTFEEFSIAFELMKDAFCFTWEEIEAALRILRSHEGAD